MADNQVEGGSAVSNGVGNDAAAASAPSMGVPAGSGRAGAWSHVGELIRTIRDGDDAMVEAAHLVDEGA